MTDEANTLAEQLRRQIQSRLHTGLEVSTEAIPNGEAIRVDIVFPGEADSRAPWSRHVLVAELRTGEEAIEGMAQLLAERASREWLARESDGVEN